MKKNIIFGIFGIFIILLLIKSGSKHEIRIKEYFPIKKTYKITYSGVFTDKTSNEIINFTMDLECIGEQKIQDYTAFVHKQIYIDENNNVIFDKEKYYGYYNDTHITELGSKENNVLLWHEEPNFYLYNLKIGQENLGKYGKGRFVLKEIKDIEINNNKFEDCLIYEKTFYENKQIIRKEVLYLYKGIGVIKYFEENYANPCTIEMSIKSNIGKIN